jgi:glycosyltransferase involved in cell wall biosynthesis
MGKYLFIAANEAAKWAGSEPLWGGAAERLARRGNEVRVSSKDWGEPIPQIEQLGSAGCRIFRRRPPTLAQRFRRRFLRAPEFADEHLSLAGHGMDLVVISQGLNTEGLLWMEAARAARYQYAIIAQGAAEQWWPYDEVAERLAEGYENASATYFVSQANVDLCRRQFGTPLRNAKVVRNPFNVRYDARPAWPADFSDGLSLASVARLDVSQKGQDLLLEVLGLSHWRHRKIRVSLVGTGIHERGLRRIVEQQKLTSVEFAGFVSNIEEVWSKHHALVLASRYEGMPLALVEAMLCGRPCIVTDVAGHAQLVRDGVNGFLLKAPTLGLLDEAMNRAWDDRGRLEEMGRTAAKDVRRWVSADPVGDFVRELEALVESR